MNRIKMTSDGRRRQGSNQMTQHRAHIRRGLVSACAFALGSTLVPPAKAEIVPAVDKGSLDLRCGSIWDGKGGRRTGPIALVVRGGRIASIVPDSGPLRKDEIDLLAATCLPGLIDAHTHVMLESDRLEGDYDRQLLKESPEFRTIVAVGHARRMIDWGFTTIRDLGSEGAGFGDVAVRDAIDKGLVVGPRMQVSTLGISATAAYPLLGYAPGLAVPRGVEEITGPEEARRAVRRQIGNGADLIKLYADRAPRSGPGNTLLATPTLTFEEMRVAADEAHRQRRKVAVNSRSASSARDAIAAGADSIEHGDYLDIDNVREMARRGVVYVPDFDTDPKVASARAAAGNQVWTSIPEIKCRTLARAVEGGVQIAFGSGIGGADWDFNAAGAFRPMAACGMTPEQVLVSATRNAAILMGLDDRIGTLEPGKLGDVIAVPGNPLEDVTRLERVIFVAKGGIVVKAASPERP
jgi:imidazolonepropionase-like amidohydrolase